MLQSYGFEILVQPALYVAALIGVLVVLLKGSHRTGSIVDGEHRKGRRVLAVGAKRRALTGVIAAVVILPALVITPPGHRAAIYSLGGGVSPVERGEGLSFVIPWAQSARMVNVRTQVYVYEAYTQTCADPTVDLEVDPEVDVGAGVPDPPASGCDLQEVTLPVAINYSVDPDMAAEVYRDIGLNYASVAIDPIVFQATTQATGELTASEIVSRRSAFALSIRQILAEHLGPRGIVVETVSIKDAIFDPAFIQSVKDKIIADQKAAEAARLVQVAVAEAQAVRERADGDRDAAIAKAEGEKKSVELVAAALGFTPNEYLEYLRLQRWDGILPKTVVGSEAGSLIFDVGTPVE
jgi:regulator of protease activity HflC (stomatin/prohibitin superfamily)